MDFIKFKIVVNLNTRTLIRKLIKKVDTIQMKLLNLNDCGIRLRLREKRK